MIGAVDAIQLWEITHMRSRILFILAALSSMAACSKESSSSSAIVPIAGAQTSRAPQNDVQWGPAPSVFPPGAEMAVMQGDPSKAEPFTVRMRFPNGYKLPPHTHPTTENVTVLTGTFLAG